MQSKSKTSFYVVVALAFLAIIGLVGSIIHQSLVRRELKSLGNYTIADNISSADVTAMKMDSEGRMWIGTSDGLNFFDGHKYVQFHFDANDTTTIPNDNIQDILFDKKRRLWVATTEGLAQYIGNYTFKRYNFPNSNDISQITEDHQGNVFVNNQIAIYRIDSLGIKRIHLFDKAHQSSGINGFAPDQSGGYWIVTPQSISHYSNQGKRIQRYNNLSVW